MVYTRRVLGGQLRVSEAGYLHLGERGRKAGEAAMAIIGEKFTEMFLGKENVNPRDKDLIHAQAYRMAMEGDLAQAKAVEAKAKNAAWPVRVRTEAESEVAAY